MKSNTETVILPAEYASEMLPKLVSFSVACLAGWIVAVIIHQTIDWFRGPTSHDAAAIGATVKHVLEQIRNTLYR